MVKSQDAGERLDRALCRWLSEAVGAPVTRGQAKDLLDQGAVYLNGQRVRIASKTLRPGARIEVRVPLDTLRKPTASQWVLTPDRILFEDDDIIAINKPPGLPTQATRDPDRDHLFAAVQRYAAQSTRLDPDRAYVGLHHRLDTDASGIVLMTRSRRANAHIMSLFQDRLAQKTYLALTHPHSSENPTNSNNKTPQLPQPIQPIQPIQPPDTWQMSGPLRRPGPEGQTDDGRWAESDCHILHRYPHGLLVQVHPHTGRRHQVRLHLALSGIPILGDAAYGMRSAYVHPHRLMLHAHALTFTHPITLDPITLTSPLPDDIALIQSHLADTQ